MFVSISGGAMRSAISAGANSSYLPTIAYNVVAHSSLDYSKNFDW